jgi:polysaccharide biosynthesis protein PslH
MKILILSSKVPYPAKDGGAIATLGLANGLAELGNEVTMLCLNTSKHFIADEDLPESLRAKIRIISVYHNTSIRIHKAAINLFLSTEPYNGIRFISHQYENELKKLLSEVTFDVVQVEGPYMGYYIPMVRKYSKAAISLRAHNVEHEIWARKAQNDINPFRSLYLRNLSKRVKGLEDKILNSIDYLIAISERDRKQLLNLNKGLKSVVIPAGLDPSSYPPPKEPEYPSLFFIGSLDWMPNQEGLIWFIENVWPIIQRDHNIPFHVAGRNAPEWLKVKLIASDVIFHGEVENAYEFMNNYAMMISPVLSGSGIRVKILEAMMMGKAVISTRIGAEGISYIHAENILLADDPAIFAKIIKEYSLNKTEYERISNSGRMFVIENFNNSAFCKNLTEFYSNSLR